MIDRLAARISYQMYKSKLYTHEQIRQIQYGLQSVMSEGVKLFFIGLLLYFSGYLWYGIFAILVFGSVRIWAGGYHADSYFKCFIVSMGIIYATVFMGLYIQNDIFFLIEGIFVFIIIYIFAPADHRNQPIISSKRRKKIKRIAIAMTTFWVIVLYFISSPWKYIGMHSILFEAMIIIYMILIEQEQISIEYKNNM